MFTVTRCLLTLLICTPVLAAPAEELIAQLDSENWLDRERAQTELIELRDQAEEAVRRKLEDQQISAEMRHRLEAILRAIDGITRTGPSLITLDFTDTPAAEVLEEIARQAGATVGYMPPNLGASLPRITLQVERESFWEVMRRIHELTGLQPTAHNEIGKLMLSAGNRQPAPHFHIHGPFMVTASQTHSARQIDLVTGHTSESLSLMLTLQAEPKLLLTGSGTLPQLELVEDNEGRSLLLDQGRHAGVANHGNQVRQVSVQLRTDQGRGSSIRLKGSITARWAAEVHQFRLPLEVGARTTHGGLATEIIALERPAADQITVKVRVDDPGASDHMSAARQLASGNALRIVDAEGNPWMTSSRSVGGSATRIEANVTLMRGAAGEAVSLILDAPMSFRDTTVEFELKDIPLP